MEPLRLTGSYLDNQDYLNGFQLYGAFDMAVSSGGETSRNCRSIIVMATDSVEMKHVQGQRDEDGVLVLDGTLKPAELTTHFGDHPHDGITFSHERDGAYIPWLQKTPHLTTTTIKVFGIVEANAFHTLGQHFIPKRELAAAQRYKCWQYEQKQSNIKPGLSLVAPPPVSKSSWEFKHNFCSSALHLTLKVPRNEEEYHKYMNSAKSMLEYEEKYATRSMLEDQPEMNEMIKQTASTMSTTVHQNMQLEGDVMAGTFAPNLSMLPFFGEFFRYDLFGPMIGANRSEKLPFALLVADVCTATNANGHCWNELLKVKYENACCFLAKVLTASRYNGVSVPYVSDYMVNKVVADPANNTELPFKFTVGEDVRCSLRIPYPPPGRIQAKDCDGQTTELFAAFKTVEMLDTLGDVNNAESFTKSAFAPYDKEGITLLQKISHEQRVAICTFLLHCHDCICKGHIRFNNPLGGACAASAQDASIATNPKAVGGHSWASLEWYQSLHYYENSSDKTPKNIWPLGENEGENESKHDSQQDREASNVKPTRAFIMEGTSPVHEVQLSSHAPIVSKVLGNKNISQQLVQWGFKDTGESEDGLEVFSKEISPTMAMHMAEMTPHLAPIANSASRPEIPFSFLNRHFEVGVDPCFYLNVYYGNGCVYSYDDPKTGERRFGTPWASFNYDLPNINVHKTCWPAKRDEKPDSGVRRIAMKPFDDDEQTSRKLQFYVFRRFKEIALPHMDPMKLTKRCSEVWTPSKFLYETPVIPLVCTSHSEMKTMQLKTGGKKGKITSVLSPDDYEAVTVCDSFANTETAKSWMPKLEDIKTKANAEYEQKGLKHFMNVFLDKSGIARTFFVYLPDLAKKHIVQMPGC
jgi:hypothetical protein